MREILLVIHLFVSIALVAVILLQRSEGGALGIGGGGGGGLMTARGAGNLLTRLTAYLAIAFMALAIAQAVLVGLSRGTSSLMEDVPAQTSPVDENALPTLDVPAAPETPSESDASDVPQPN